MSTREELRERAERFCRTELVHGTSLPEDESIPAVDREAKELVARLARHGLLEVVAPPASALDICAVREVLARHSGLADTMFVMQGLGCSPIFFAGSPDQRSAHLPPIARGETIAAFALTEPEAGSDVGAIATSARREGDAWVLDGCKTFISNAGIADLYCLFARTSGAGRKGLSVFAVPATAPGLSVRERLALLAPHPIGTLELSGCRLPASSLIGEEGDGHRIAMACLDRFRPTVGAAALGFARRALDEAVSRARSRVQFGKPIGQLQAIQLVVADMATRIDAGRLLVDRAARSVDGGRAEATRHSAMAKLWATETAQGVVDGALQIHGGTGLVRGGIMERLYREVRALRIYEGTSEIQRLVIAREVLR